MPLEPNRNSFLTLDPHGYHRVAIYKWGDPRQHHVVVCVHGLTRNGRDFDILATHLAQHCRVVAKDVVGRGASEWLVHKRDYGFPLYLADAATYSGRPWRTSRAGVPQGMRRSATSPRCATSARGIVVCTPVCPGLPPFAALPQ